MPRDVVFGGLLDLPRRLQRAALLSARVTRAVHRFAIHSAPMGATVWRALLADPLDSPANDALRAAGRAVQ